MTANLTQLLEGVSLIIALVTVPLMANTVMGKDPLTGAWWLLRMTVMIPVGAVAGGILVGFVGIRPVTIAGLGLAALGLFLIGTWDLDVGEPSITLHLMIAGVGFGLNNAPIMTRAPQLCRRGVQGYRSVFGHRFADDRNGAGSGGAIGVGGGAFPGAYRRAGAAYRTSRRECRGATGPPR